jgi:hypothetical protein
MPFFRADRNVPMHLIKPEIRRQDLEGIHLPSFRFSCKLKKLCRVDFFVFESWQTAVKSQGKTMTGAESDWRATVTLGCPRWLAVNTIYDMAK